MKREREIQVVVRRVTFKQADENDDEYFAKMSYEDRLKECFDLRKLNYFGNVKGELPKIERVIRRVKLGEDE